MLVNLPGDFDEALVFQNLLPVRSELGRKVTLFIFPSNLDVMT